MSERQKFIAAVIFVILGGIASIAAASLIFYWLGVPCRQATLAGAVLVSMLCKIADVIIMLRGGK